MTHVNKKTDVSTMIADLDGGVFEAKVSEALSQVALGVIKTGNQGKVTIEFNLKQMGNAAQVLIDHTVKFTKPTPRGRAIEEDKTTTPMYVGRGGLLSIDQQDQLSLFKGLDTKQAAVAEFNE